MTKDELDSRSDVDMWTNIFEGSVQHSLAVDIAHTINAIAYQWTRTGRRSLLQFCPILHSN